MQLWKCKVCKNMHEGVSALENCPDCGASKQNIQGRFTVADFRQAKKAGIKISMLTAYDYPTAKLVDHAGIDSILVGDSLGMVVLGYDDTLRVTVEDMIHHIKAVARGTGRAMVIGDMPFLSYHTGKYDSVRNAGRLISDGGCKAVKLEGGEEFTEDIKTIIRAGIPVMGHLGFTPQSVNLIGRPMAQGKTIETAARILKDALLLQDAGVFSIVLECVPWKLAAYITSKLDIPTIGIGSGAGCDGQVLLSTEITGLYTDFTPKHTKRFADLGSLFIDAAKTYIKEIEEGSFPTEKNSFTVDDKVLEQISESFKND
jgi:3-methyl-2-oxobutanoate hydroxymethyltransferase